MKKSTIKAVAKQEMLIAMQVAFHSIGSSRSGSYIEDEAERAEVFAAMDTQFKRIEKL